MSNLGVTKGTQFEEQIEGLAKGEEGGASMYAALSFLAKEKGLDEVSEELTKIAIDELRHAGLYSVLNGHVSDDIFSILEKFAPIETGGLEKLQQFLMDYNSKNKFTSSVTDFFNQFQELLKNLSLVDLCILLDILGIIIIFSCVMSIIFAYYGNYLISKYTLDQKFPRLSKLISLRVKFQHYSIFLNLFLIMVTLIVLFLVNCLNISVHL